MGFKKHGKYSAAVWIQPNHPSLTNEPSLLLSSPSSKRNEKLSRERTVRSWGRRRGGSVRLHLGETLGRCRAHRSSQTPRKRLYLTNTESKPRVKRHCLAEMENWLLLASPEQPDGLDQNQTPASHGGELLFYFILFHYFVLFCFIILFYLFYII